MVGCLHAEAEFYARFSLSCRSLLSIGLQIGNDAQNGSLQLPQGRIIWSESFHALHLFKRRQKQLDQAGGVPDHHYRRLDAAKRCYGLAIATKTQQFSETVMERTVREHVVGLQERLLMLRDQLTKPSLSNTEGVRIQRKIATVELALTRFLEALEVERKIA